MAQCRWREKDCEKDKDSANRDRKRGGTMLKAAFLGTGLISWAHSLALKAMIDSKVVDARIVSCYDVDSARAGQFAAMHGCGCKESAEEALTDVDAVWICTPTSQHRTLLEMAASHGVAVFCEKPLGRNMDEVRAMAGIVEDIRIPFQVGLVLRRCPVFIKLREIVLSGSLGKAMAVSFRDDQFFPVQGHYASTWRGDVEQAGGGAVIEHSIHDLDILRYCFGEIRSISATTSNFAGYNGIEDAAAVNLAFESGLSGSLVSAWHQILSRPSTRRVETIFEHGIVWLENDFVGPLHLLTDNGEEAIECPPPSWVEDLPLPDNEIGIAIRMYAESDRSFAESVMTGTKPSPSIEEAVQAHKLVDAVYTSASAGGTPVPALA
ncbi:MAG: Gfo/Idh/MocA family oxidoreductase [Actinobacteria bacterium]|nr:Gfo/Idh/MocA family oxidoreductase [Actinomycetota bacterium]